MTLRGNIFCIFRLYICHALEHSYFLSFFVFWIMINYVAAVKEGNLVEGCRESWNVSVVLTSWRPPAVRVQWHFKPINFSIARFELTYRPTNARYRIVHDIPGSDRSLTLRHLEPATEYQLYLVAFARSGIPTNISGKVHFISPDVTQNDTYSLGAELTQSEEETTVHITVRKEEVIIVVFALSFWVFVILLFFRNWGKIRAIEGYQFQYHLHERKPVTSRLNDPESYNLDWQSAIPPAPYHNPMRSYHSGMKPYSVPMTPDDESIPPYHDSMMEYHDGILPYHEIDMRPKRNKTFFGNPYRRASSTSMFSESKYNRKVQSNLW